MSEKPTMLDDDAVTMTEADINNEFEELVNTDEKEILTKKKKSFLPDIGKELKKTADSIGSAANKVSKASADFGKAVMDTGGKIVDTVTDIDAIAKTSANIGKTVVDAGSNIINTVTKTDYKELGENIVNTSAKVAGDVISEAGKTAGNVISEAKKGIDYAGKKTNELIETAKTTITPEQMEELLDSCYNKAMTGIPGVSKSVDQLADDYLSKNKNKELAAKSLINNQLIKCTTSGFLTSLGGLITLPIALPANITSVLYVQMRMIAAVAKIGGFNPSDDQVQTLVYVCLTGQAVGDVLKSTGVKLSSKLATSGIQKISGATLTKINQKVGFRLITKFGEKGIINLGKAVPVVGGIVGGGFDYVSTKVIAKNAYKTFILNDIS